MSRPPKLSSAKLRLVDAWKLSRHIPRKTIAAQLGISKNTMLDAELRRRGYRRG